MINVMTTEDRLREVLLRVEGATEVDVVREGTKLIGVVVSPAFAGKDEHVRQARVWDVLLTELSDAEVAEIGFVFTNTPEEQAGLASQPA